MSDNDSTFEEQILTGAILGFFTGLGYFIRSLSFIDFSIIDGIITIVAICLGVLVIIAAVLLSFGSGKE